MFHLLNVNCRYGDRTVLTVRELTIGNARLTAIVGRNGSGKSTLLRCLARDVKPSSGQIFLDDAPTNALSTSKFAQRVAYLPQHAPAAPGLTVNELVALGRYPWRGVFGLHKAEDQQIIRDSLARTGLAKAADRMVEELSGGERQRAWVAMLLAQQSPILLLDEPTSALDLAYQVSTLRLLRDLTCDGMRIVLALHDINMAARFADQIIALRDGKTMFNGNPKTFMERERL